MLSSPIQSGFFLSLTKRRHGSCVYIQQIGQAIEALWTLGTEQSLNGLEPTPYSLRAFPVSRKSLSLDYSAFYDQYVGCLTMLLRLPHLRPRGRMRHPRAHN